MSLISSKIWQEEVMHEKARTDPMALDAEDGTVCAHCGAPRNTIHSPMCEMRAGAEPRRKPCTRSGIATLLAFCREALPMVEQERIGVVLTSGRELDVAYHRATVVVFDETCRTVALEISSARSYASAEAAVASLLAHVERAEEGP